MWVLHVPNLSNKDNQESEIPQTEAQLLEEFLDEQYNQKLLEAQKKKEKAKRKRGKRRNKVKLQKFIAKKKELRKQVSEFTIILNE